MVAHSLQEKSRAKIRERVSEIWLNFVSRDALIVVKTPLEFLSRILDQLYGKKILSWKGFWRTSLNAIETVGERLATLCVGFTLPPQVPQYVLDAHPVPPWLTLSLATLYLSFAKHWLAFLPVREVWMAVGRHMDDCFFDLVNQTSFEVKISDVIVHPAERAAVCSRAHIPLNEFDETVSTTETILSIVFSDRCNQYTRDPRAGIVREQEGKQSVLAPLIFVCKRFNQHMYAVECDERSIDLDEKLRFLVELDHMFMDALQVITECVKESAKELPFSL